MSGHERPTCWNSSRFELVQTLCLLIPFSGWITALVVNTAPASRWGTPGPVSPPKALKRKKKNTIPAVKHPYSTNKRVLLEYTWKYKYRLQSVLKTEQKPVHSCWGNTHRFLFLLYMLGLNYSPAFALPRGKMCK